jgi:hypothetical protein
LKVLFLLWAQKVIDRHGEIKIEPYLNFYFTQLRSLTAYLSALNGVIRWKLSVYLPPEDD